MRLSLSLLEEWDTNSWSYRQHSQGAVPQCDEEEIKKGRLYGGLKLHLKSAMTFCRDMANEGRPNLSINFSKLPDVLKQIMRIKNPQDIKKTG